VGLRIVARPTPPTAEIEIPRAWECELGWWVWRRRWRDPSRWTALQQKEADPRKAVFDFLLPSEIRFCNIAGAFVLFCGAFSCVARLDYVTRGHAIKPDINGYRLYRRDRPNWEDCNGPTVLVLLIVRAHGVRARPWRERRPPGRAELAWRRGVGAWYRAWCAFCGRVACVAGFTLTKNCLLYTWSLMWSMPVLVADTAVETEI